MGAGGALLMGQALLPDTIEYDYLRTGLRREGVFSAIYSFMEKASFAFGPLIVGTVLAFSGYVATKAGQPNAVQPSSALHGIYVAISILPAITSSICLVLLRFYNLTEDRLKVAEIHRATKTLTGQLREV
jgi:GPH family glycoside/pentoside/hexuronide:cation symporter